LIANNGGPGPGILFFERRLGQPVIGRCADRIIGLWPERLIRLFGHTVIFYLIVLSRRGIITISTPLVQDA
jgi:hypothetical protein